MAPGHRLPGECRRRSAGYPHVCRSQALARASRRGALTRVGARDVAGSTAAPSCGQLARSRLRAATAASQRVDGQRLDLADFVAAPSGGSLPGDPDRQPRHGLVPQCPCAFHDRLTWPTMRMTCSSPGPDGSSLREHHRPRRSTAQQLRNEFVHDVGMCFGKALCSELPEPGEVLSQVPADSRLDEQDKQGSVT
jgi:hypothetical protein